MEPLNEKEELVSETDYMCDECHDSRFVSVEEFDDIRDAPCPNCNAKTTVEEDMDDDS